MSRHALKRLSRARLTAALGAAAILSVTGCKPQQEGDGAPPPARVIEVQDMNLITIDSQDAGKFNLVSAERFESAPELNVTGSVFPDVAREVPVISVANGRVVDIKTRLDDYVKKGQLLFRVQSPDIANAFNAYQKAVNDEHLANSALVRANDLLQHRAISVAMQEQAENTENDAKADLIAAEQQLEALGVDKQQPGSTVSVYSPISGVIIGQNVTNSSAAGVTLSGSATAFTVADLSTVWIICDVYENDLPRVTLGQEAKITVNAYPDRPFTGIISDIGPVLDPSLRTAKVRIQVKNPGFLKLGMFATATFTSKRMETHVAVPAESVLHLHDRDWVFEMAGENQFKRMEVRPGRMLPGDRQEILSGLTPGQRIVDKALMLETARNQQ